MSRFIIAMLILTLLAGCSLISDSGPEIDSFIIAVDGITAPDTMRVGDTLTVYLDGFIGPDGCYYFSHFEETLTPSSADLTVWGRHRLGGLCTDALVYLDGRPWSVRTEHSGTYRIRIVRPDGSALDHSVTVVE